MKNIFIVLINYNGQDNTIECLDNLRSISTEGFILNTIVVDNLSKNKLIIDEVDYRKIKLSVIYNNVNSGFSGGCNIGIKKALEQGADYILLLNNDTLVHENFLVELFDFMEKKSEVGIVSPKIYFEKGFEFHKERYRNDELGKVFWYAGGKFDWKNIIGQHVGVDQVDDGQFEESVPVDFATGCCVLIRKEMFKLVGFFDEKYFLYYEDADYSVRVLKKGYKIFYVPKSIIWHKNAGSSGSGSSLQDYYITRNRLYFGVKYASSRAKIALIRESLRILINGNRFKKRAIFDFYTGRFGRSNLFK